MGEANAVVDANYALTDIVSPALNLHFARNAMGSISALGNAPGASPATETYSYDPLYRLTGMNDANGNVEEAYTYSKAGDRLSKTATGLDSGTYSYQSGTHHLASIGNAARAYDANGNTTGSVVGGNTYGFGYNGRNRMAVAQLNGSTVGTYTYNALGQRVAKVATIPAATSQRFVYDESGQLISEYGSNTRDYVMLGNLPVAVVDTAGVTSTVSYVTADGLNTPRAVADGNGNTLWQWAYQDNPFGEQPPTSSSGFVYNPRFMGQYYDAETGLNYNGARYYESARGGYGQADPLGPWGGPNPYSYAGNSPLSYIDPSGMQVAPIVPPEAAVEEVPPEARAIEAEAREEAREENMEREYARREANGTLPGRRVPASQFGANGMCRAGDFDGPEATVGPVGGNGGSPDFLTPNQALRIQNAANRIGKPINVVGSRATGTAGPNSDWDYVIDANAPTRNSVSRSLPGAGDLNDGVRPNLDVFNGQVTPGAPYILFVPRSQ